MMRALLLLLALPAVAHADRATCDKAGGAWTKTAQGDGCMVRGKQHGVWELRSPTGQLITRQTYTHGVLDGPTVSFHDTCELAEKGAYAAGDRTGAWLTRFDNGQRQAEGPYKAGLRHGVWKFYMEDQPIIEGPMVDDSATGEFTERFTTGVTWRKVTMKDGKHQTTEALDCEGLGGVYDIDYEKRTEGCLDGTNRTGTWQGYAPDGKLEWRTQYRGNYEHGERVEFHPDGKVLRRGQMEHGNPVGLHEFRSPTGQLYGASTITTGPSTWKAYFPDGTVAEVGQYDLGFRVGTWQTFHRKGALHHETTWARSLRNGPYREHYPTGEVKFVGAYEDDSRAGTWRAVYMNGNTVWTGRYDDTGAQTGLWFIGNYNGTANAFGTMAANKRDGLWTLFHDDGVLAGIGLYVRGKKHGTWFEWWPSGKFWRKVEYANDLDDSDVARACAAKGGVWFADDKERAVGCQVCRSSKEDDVGPVNQLRDGIWTWWHANTALEKQGAFAVGDRVGRWQSWFDNGQLMLENTFVAGKEQGPTRGFYRDGKKRFIGSYVAGAEDGAWTTYHPDGTVASTGTYAAGKKTGPWSYAYPGGAKKETGAYTDGLPAGVWTSYHPNGTKASEGSYALGKRDGTWTYWRADGAVWRTEQLVAGKRVER